MNKSIVVLLALGCLAVSGCQSAPGPYDPPKPLDQMSPAELCSYYLVYLSNPAISDESRKIATGKMATMGCPAAPAPAARR
jgi:hypothetical protein